MGLWAKFVDGVSTVTDYISTGVKWIWDNLSFNRINGAALHYAKNTSVQMLEQVAALGASIPSLVNHPKSRKILDSMAYIVVHDVLPVVSVNYINQTVQNYFRQGIDEEALPWLSAYSGVITMLNMTNTAVRLYTYRQGAQTLIRVTIVDMLGPSAFNKHKLSNPPPSLCLDKKCTGKRKIKGSLREPFILLANDLVTAGISYVPYVGKPTAFVLSTFFAGRYITRVVTPERCDRHKAMMQESVLALGLSYQASLFLINSVLGATVGMPPYLCYRTLKHLLLLLHINNAAHMSIPLVSQDEATIPVDLLNVYEATSRFIADVIAEGLIKRIPIDFQFDKNAKPIIPLSTALQFGTRLLKNDMEIENIPEPGFFSSAAKTIRLWVTPQLLHSPRDLINDPIISKYWPRLRKGAITSIEIIQKAGQSTTAATLAWAPKSVATAIKLTTGIPKNVTKIVLMLTQDEDFWEFVNALKLWFERHDLKAEVVLVNSDKITLNGEKPILDFPNIIGLKPVNSSSNITSDKPQIIVSDANKLRSIKRSQSHQVVANDSSMLFSSRAHRQKQKEDSITFNENHFTY